jgi:nicotinamidase-related amidase
MGVSIFADSGNCSDVQNDFLPGGALAVKGSDSILDPVRKLLDKTWDWPLVVVSQVSYPHPHTNQDHLTYTAAFCRTGIRGVMFLSQASISSRSPSYTRMTREEITSTFLRPKDSRNRQRGNCSGPIIV